MTPSRRIQSRIDSIESSIERMKQAEHCGASSKPTLNQTGELKEAYWLTRIVFSSASNVSASSSVAKYPPVRPQPPIVSTTRPTICFTLDSRSGELIRPRKYFWATMFVAVCDQNFGNSTPRCSNAGPLRPGIRASRVSHSISSKGSRPGIVKKRRTPRRAPSSVTVLTTSSVVGSVVFCCSTLAMAGPFHCSPVDVLDVPVGACLRLERGDRRLGLGSDGTCGARMRRRRGDPAGLEPSREPGRGRRQEQQERQAAEDEERQRNGLRVARP